MSEETSALSDEAFRAERQRIFVEFMTNRGKSRLGDNVVAALYGEDFLEYWYLRGKDASDLLYVKIIYQPDSLSGHILEYTADLPQLHTHSEIKGDIIRPVPYKPRPKYPDDSEDVTHDLLQLPLIKFDPTIHFTKTCLYKREIENHLKSQLNGGSRYVIKLLGRTEDGRLVFPLYSHGAENVAQQYRDTLTISLVKCWSLQLAEAVCFLHSIDIVHHDLASRNVLATEGDQDLVLCDLESRHGSHAVPEILNTFDLDPYERPYTKATDVHAFGQLLNDLIMGTPVSNKWIFWSAPAPFRSIISACQAKDPADRPTMPQVKTMLEAIVVPGWSSIFYISHWTETKQVPFSYQVMWILYFGLSMDSHGRLRVTDESIRDGHQPFHND
ncbi:hypothetical protein C0995_001666 [Termitomyces sp. Mi166|nr:hypothetical protein C0995_001666 [Termitomyces sp. Mi166\